jgi:CBS domain-containing protein
MKGRPAEYDEIADKFQFSDAKSNFIRAARTGSESIMNWMGRTLSLNDLVLNELLPIARKGLEQMKINPTHIDEYLGIIEKRLRTQTASQWAVSNFRALKKTIKSDDAIIALTAAMYNNQQKAGTVSDWPAIKNASRFDAMASRVGHVMTTTLVTAFDNDLALLTLKYMKWNNIHHLPIVDHQQKLVGLITWRHLQGYWQEVQDEKKPLVAGDIMVKEVFTAHPSDTIKETISLMKKHEIGCLPVVQHEQLVGIVTIKDLKHLEHG